MSEAPAGSPERHPIGLIVTDDLRRSRLTTFFRLILAIPHLIWVGLWGIAAVVVAIIGWFAAIFSGRLPQGMHDFLAAYTRYYTRVRAYTYLLAEPFPPFSSAGQYPVDLRIDPREEQSRATIFLRLILAIPAFLLTYVFQNVNTLLAILSWFYILFTGRMHEGMRNLGAWMLRYEMQTYAYAELLTGRYPSLAGAPSA